MKLGETLYTLCVLTSTQLASSPFQQLLYATPITPHYPHHPHGPSPPKLPKCRGKPIPWLQPKDFIEKCAQVVEILTLEILLNSLYL